MHRPQNLTAFEEAQADRLEDLSATLASLRRAVTRGDRIAIETYCHGLLPPPRPVAHRHGRRRTNSAHSPPTSPAASSSEFTSGCANSSISLVSALESQLEIASE